MNPEQPRKRTPRLVAQARPGVHQVKVFNCYIKKSGYVKATDTQSVSKFMYARVRKETFEDPSEKAFISAVFKMAHTMLDRNLQISLLKSKNK